MERREVSTAADDIATGTHDRTGGNRLLAELFEVLRMGYLNFISLVQAHKRSTDRDVYLFSFASLS